MPMPEPQRSEHDFLLFDLDGTLSDPIEGIGRSINHALGFFDVPPLPLDALAKYIGPPLDETFIALTGRSDEVDIRDFVARYRERYIEVGYAENVLYPGVADALAALHAAGIPMGVCTTKRADYAERIVAMFGLAPYFRFVDGAEIGIHKWQQIEALVRRGIVTPASLMIGDRALDMIAAHRNGLQAGAVLWGYGSQAELQAEQPRYCFEAPADWTGLLRR